MTTSSGWPPTAYVHRLAPRMWETVIYINDIPVRVVQFTTWDKAFTFALQRVGLAPVLVGAR